MKYILYIAFFTSFSINLFSQKQKIDSLWREYKKTNIDTVRCELLSDIVIAYFYLDREKCFVYNDSLLKISEGVSRKYEAHAYLTKGQLFRQQRKMDESLQMYNKTLAIAQELKDVALQAKTYSSLATYYSHLANFDSSVSLHLRAIRLNKSIGYNQANMGSYTNLGVHFTRKKQYKKAVFYLKNALHIADSVHNDIMRASIKIELAMTYLNLEQYDKSQFFLTSAIKIAKKTENVRAVYNYYRVSADLAKMRKDSHQKIINYYDSTLTYAHIGKDVHGIYYAQLNLGQEYMRHNNYDGAQIYLDSAYKICKNVKYDEGEAMTLLELGRISVLKGEVKKGVRLIKTAKSKLGSIHKTYPEHFVNITTALANAGEYKLAYEELSDYYSISDSVFLKNSSLKVEAAEQKYEAEKKEKEILQYKSNQTEQANRIRLLTGSSLALLLLFGVFGFYYRRNKKQKDKIVALQKELHHRVDNNLAIIDEFIDRTKETVKDKNLLDELSNLQNRVGSINEVHRMLYQEDDITSISLKKYIQTLGEQIQTIFKKDNVNINVSIPESSRMTTENSVPLGLIVNEFITNSFKYAFNNITRPEISISASESSNELVVSLKDNGIGFNHNNQNENVESYGTDIMSLLAKQMKATYLFDGKDGVSLTLRIPKI